jgi:hypothetical protein
VTGAVVLGEPSGAAFFWLARALPRKVRADNRPLARFRHALRKGKDSVFDLSSDHPQSPDGLLAEDQVEA